MICDVCGRDNADTLTFCQDCGRRLRSPRVVAPTPPNGVPTAAAAQSLVSPPEQAIVTRAAPPAREERASVPSAPPSQRRVSRPAAPTFSFQPIESATVVCGACQTPNPPDYRFCVTCGASLKRAINGASSESRRTDEGFVAAKPAASPGPAREGGAIDPPPRAARARADEPSAEGKIVGSPVLDIASSGSVPAKLIACARCHGNCVAGSRFCKFCGAPLEEPAAAKLAPPPAETTRPIVRLPVPPAPPVEPSRAAPTAAYRSPPDESTLRTPISNLARSSDDDRPSAPDDPPPPRPIAAAPRAVPAPAPSGPGGARPQAPVEPGRRAEISVLAGSPLPPEPTNLPPQRAARDGVRRETGRKHAGRLVVIVEDGSEGRSFSLADGQLDIGRTDGDIVLEDDHYVSPRHARLRFLDGQWILRDLDSTNHVYLRIRKPQPLKDGDLLLLGLEVLQFQTVSDGERGLGHAMQHGTLLFGSPATPRRARLCQRTVEGVVRDVFHLFRDETVIGRETGDIVFTADPFLSRRHAVLRRNATSGEFTLLDLDSSNGTFIAIQGEVILANGDFLRIGQHLFRVDLG